MSAVELIHLLERRHGLRTDELTVARLQRVLATDAGPDGDLDAQARDVVADPLLLQHLLDRITLQETSFFRDAPVFAALSSRVVPAAITAAAGGPVVVWSAGCANGQEAWSLAMLLTELGASRFEVVASDLSQTAVARAQRGVYEERELRGLDETRRLRHLVRTGAGWEVRPELRRHVRVVHHNAATDPAPVPDGGCALVLCRYVLIYLTSEASDALLGRIADVLTPGGRLVIGAAESLWHLTERYATEALPGAVAYRIRRPGDAAGPTEAARRLTAARSGWEPTSRPEPAPLRREPARRAAPTTARADAGPPTRLGAGGPDAAALVREGEAAAAAGDLTAAAAAFRGAAYLDPDDAVALMRLGLMLEALDDPGAGRAFRAASGAVQRRTPEQLEQALGGYGAASLIELLAAKLQQEPA